MIIIVFILLLVSLYGYYYFGKKRLERITRQREKRKKDLASLLEKIKPD